MRVFSVDQMCEVGPALTSPTQFDMALADEDERENTSSESNRLYSSFFSSPLVIETAVSELTSWSKTPTPRSMHRLSNHPRGSPQMQHQSHPPGIQHHALNPVFHPPPLPYNIPIQGGCGSAEHDPSLWDTDRASTSIQLCTSPSGASLVPSGQLQHAMPSHSVPEWQFANAHTQPSAYPFQPTLLSPPDSSHLFQPLPDNDQSMFIPTMPWQKNVGIDLPWIHESDTTRVPSVMHPRTHMMAQWPSGLVLPDTLQTSGSSLSPAGGFHDLVSDHGNSSYPEDSLDAFPHAEGCRSTNLEMINVSNDGIH